MAKLILLLCKGLLFLQMLQLILADGHVNIQIQVLQYDNPSGTSYHGSDLTSQRKCCDRGNVPHCNGTDLCDSYFVLCIGGINSRGACNGPGATTTVLSNKNSFSTSYDNTIIHSFKWAHWKSSAIEYIADVMDKDGSSKDLVDNFTSTVSLRADSHYDNSTPQVMSFKNFVSLDIGVRIWCQDGYTGPDCSHSCTTKPYSVCTQNHGATLLPSCSNSDVSNIKFSLNQIPVNYTPYYIQQLLTKFVQQEICSGAHEIDVKVLHFSLGGSIEFTTECDNTTLSSLLFTTHIYILSLTNNAALTRYFPHISVPPVIKKLKAGARVIMMIRGVSYHDATQSCGHNGCNIRISVCLKAANNQGSCQITLDMQSTLTSTNLTICDGYLVGSSSTGHGSYLTSFSSLPVLHVDVKYGQTAKLQSQQQLPSTYTVGVTFNQATTVQMTFSSSDKSKTFVLELMAWCDSKHAGDHCQQSCHAPGNTICDRNGVAHCKTGFHGSSCSDINECQGQSPCKNGGSCHNTPGSFTCTCQAGWTGPTCEVVTDKCALGLCTNARSCTKISGKYICRCAHGFTGNYCTDSNECNNPNIKICQHNATCLNKYGSYHCLCPDGFTGRRCEQDIDECQLSVCSSHITSCTNTVGGYSCACSVGWTGSTCHQDIDECKSNPCRNGNCSNTPGSYKCNCYPGNTGQHCEIDINECASTTCGNGGTCVNLHYPKTYRCDCLSGWDPKGRCYNHTDECKELHPCVHGSCRNKDGQYICTCADGWSGKNCSVDIDECKDNPCMHNATCINRNGGYDCKCSTRWEGTNCSIDINECHNSPCEHNATCVNFDGGYHCSCPQIWTGTKCESDVDECSQSPCKHTGTCNNFDGSYKCTCPQYWTGTNCETDINECHSAPCKNNGYCYNFDGGYNCTCSNFLTGTNCETDVNECQIMPCKHNGTCNNFDAGYNCTCPQYWTGTNCETDINECLSVPCKHNGTCNNFDGGYNCTCSQYWTGTNCETDIDECQSVPCKQNGMCNNFDGGYNCTCPQYWTGTNCETDINECQGMPCKHNGTCNNIEGKYNCTCHEDWTGLNCEIDVNECNNSPCKHLGICHNLDGGYNCTCPIQWSGINCEIDVNECAYNPCHHGGNCSNSDGGYTCICPPNWSGKRCETDINECKSSPCKNNGTCDNKAGSYSCNCTQGWQGKNCENDIDECRDNNSPCENGFVCSNTNGSFICKQDGKLPTSSFTEHAATSTKSAKSQDTSISSYTGLYTTTTTAQSGSTSESKSDIYISINPAEPSAATSSSPTWIKPNTITVSATSIQTSNSTSAAATSTLTSSLGPHVSSVAVYVRLEDAIHPGCTSSGWNITINMTELSQLYPGIKVNQIYFGDNSCRGKLMGNQLVFLQGFRDCLTAERISGDNILYENELFYAIFDPIRPFIIRQYKWKYGVECDISRNEATSSHVHHNVESHHSAISGHYRINMTFFKDPGFTNQLPGNPIQTNVGENVYVKVFTAATDWSIKMRLHTCYTKPKEAAENMTYFIIKDGCEVDSNTHIISQSTHETRFVFQDFVYSTNREGLNIYCNATFCETKDYSPGCAQSCVSYETQALVGK